MVAALVKVVVRVFAGKGVAAVVERGHFLMGSLIATPQHNNKCCCCSELHFTVRKPFEGIVYV